MVSHGKLLAERMVRVVEIAEPKFKCSHAIGEVALDRAGSKAKLGRDIRHGEVVKETEDNARPYPRRQIGESRRDVGRKVRERR